MAFDLAKFVRQHRRVRACYGDELVVPCPNCDATGAHLWINVKKAKGVCYRCRFTVSSDLDIVMAIGKFRLAEAVEMLRAHRSPIEDLHRAVAKINERVEPTKDAVEIDLPEHFELIGDVKEIPEYAQQRKIGIKACFRWGIGVCRAGFYADRLVIPIFGVDDRLMSFVARSMVGQTPKVLYPKGSPIGRMLFSEHFARHHHTVVVTEGVFDAIRVGTSAVAIFGKTASPHQVGRLAALGASRRMVIMLDRDAASEALDLGDKLRALCDDVRVATLPHGFSDPGETPRSLLREAIEVAAPVRPKGLGMLQSFAAQVRAFKRSIR